MAHQNTVKELQPFSPSGESSTLSVTREDLKIPNAKCFVLHNFLSKEECKFYIDTAEALGFESIEYEYSKEYRNSVRVIAKSRILSQQLWSRLIPYLRRDDLADIRPFGFGNEGTWRPLSVNEHFRFSKYEVGGHFNPHRDGGFVINDDLRSIYTLMVYLNDDFEGGTTKFFDENNQLVLEYKPRRGTAVIFNHDVKHSGDAVLSGQKFIFRTDIMFTRISFDIVRDKRAYLNNSDYLESERLYNESISLQKAGKPKESTEAYLAAMEIAARLPSIPSTEAVLSAPSPFEKLPIHVWFIIFDYLNISEQVKFGLVSRYAHSLATDSSVWRDKYVQRWSADIEALQQALTDHRRNFHIQTPSTVVSPSETPYNPLAQRHVTILTHDWYHIYKYRHFALIHFQVICIDIGSSFTKFFGVGLQCAKKPWRYVRDYLGFPRAIPEQEVDWVPYGSLRSVVETSIGHYWSCGSGFHDIFVGDHEGKSNDTYSDKNPFFSKKEIENGDRDTFKMFAIEAIVMFVYAQMFLKEMSCQQHPLLLPVPSWFSDSAIAMLQSSMFTYLQIPYIALVDSSVLILHRYGLTTGVVVSAGGRFTYVSAVLDGNLLDLPLQVFDATSPDNEWDVYAIDLDKDEVIERYFTENSLLTDGTVSGVNLVHMLNDCLEKAQVTVETMAKLRQNIVISGGHAHSIAPVLRSKLRQTWGDPLSTNPYYIYAPTEPGEGQFDIVRGAEVFLYLPQTLSSIMDIFTSIDDYAACVHPSYPWTRSETKHDPISPWGKNTSWRFTLQNIWRRCGTATSAGGHRKAPSKQDPNFDHIEGSEGRMNTFLRIVDEGESQKKGKYIKNLWCVGRTNGIYHQENTKR